MNLRQNIRNETKLNIYKNVAMCCMLCYSLNSNTEFSHIYSSSKNGPRSYIYYDEVRDTDPFILFNDENYILVLCPNCHRKIDSNKGRNYSPNTLINLKNEYIYRFNRIDKNINICKIILPGLLLSTLGLTTIINYLF